MAYKRIEQKSIKQVIDSMTPESTADDDEFMEAAYNFETLSQFATAARDAMIVLAWEEGATMEEIGDRVGITKQGVWKVIHRGEHRNAEDPDQLKLPGTA